jgi:hypothetical protein
LSQAEGETVFEIRSIAGSQETVLVFIKTFTLHGVPYSPGKAR